MFTFNRASYRSSYRSLIVAVALMGFVLPCLTMAADKKVDPKKEAPKKKLPAAKWRDAAEPIHVAAFEGDLASMKKILSAKELDINARLEFRTFPGYTAVHLAAFEGQAKALQMLVAKEADLNLTESSKKRTALHLAAANGRTDAVKVLIKAGADLNLKDKLGNTALSLASDKAIIAELKKAGATE